MDEREKRLIQKETVDGWGRRSKFSFFIERPKGPDNCCVLK